MPPNPAARLRLGALLIGALILVGCATLSERQCRAADWTRIGAADGNAGQSVQHLERHAAACGDLGIVPDRTAWLAGRARGLQSYCTAERAYQEGRRGRRLAPVCAAELVPRLRAANRSGLDLHDALQTIRAIETDLALVDRLLARAGDPAERADLLGARAVLLSDLLHARLDLLAAGRR